MSNTPNGRETKGEEKTAEEKKKILYLGLLLSSHVTLMSQHIYIYFFFKYSSRWPKVMQTWVSLDDDSREKQELEHC